MKGLIRSVALASTVIAFASLEVAAQVSDDVVKIAVMADMSGPFADQQGPGDVVATKLAIEDFGGMVLGKPIEIVDGDMQNKTDVGLTLARRWYDLEKVDVILGLGSSAVGIAVQNVGREKNKITIATSAGTTELTGKACSPTGMHWVYDTYALANGTATAVTKAGGDSWYFVTADYAFGHSLEKDAGGVVQKLGGKVLGSAKAPLNTNDFSSFLLQAQASKAKVIGLANAGTDTINSMKQAREFGIMAAGQKMAGLLVSLTNIRALGLKDAQGLLFTEAYYWDQNDETRAFAKRFQAKHGKPPTMMQAGIYSAAVHYLKAVKEAGTDDTQKVLTAMRRLPVNDFMTKNGTIREDGRMMRDMYLLEAKRPDESSGEWDLMKVVARIPAEQAFRPLSDSECPLIQK
ncbi:leucine-, isoleucine-, valine-, threonine-, and alanine-binding protein precursor [Variibacter gotjawalensis]|uniref:Leucine-, isoleucine-, valine-, threonine-, and alanine-binding protein n=1 Tax=Variibacter gotjawalensis TaxID=1333996 RepID=A0A0S3PX13_9BRAD|nr:ABC transporter substrate-binding protein [Variibacter gotjawalensis]NIK46305.1 branched-chain amino acid transport system substrate-binding protein [Variibacter gotjawalensis]RZS48220.1 amino acid/amide ABC transporter substrate-binding protein (HAAT family) [Variibacter gotjawalensis]BAT60477.1 leucine-, isoleucine-, valine-, threonine-, and alanine-binding protein precursor [Variibacter gotjawalensis]